MNKGKDGKKGVLPRWSRSRGRGRRVVINRKEQIGGEEIEFSFGAGSSDSSSSSVASSEYPSTSSAWKSDASGGSASGKQTGTKDCDSDDSESEWEETYLYLDLEDIGNLEELFAVIPDDFILPSVRKESSRPKKETYSELKLKLHNLESDEPILQIGKRFFEGSIEEPFGTLLFFRPKPEDPLDDSPLSKITPELKPPPDPVFGPDLIPEEEFELVAKSHKIIRMIRRKGQHEEDAQQELPDEDSTSTGDVNMEEGLYGYTDKSDDFEFKRPKTPPAVSDDDDYQQVDPEEDPLQI